MEDNKPQAIPHYMGIYPVLVDNKGRASVPKEIRNIMEQRNNPSSEIYLQFSDVRGRTGTVPAMFAYGANEWLRLADEMEKRPGSDLERICFFMAERFEIDDLGRINLGVKIGDYLGLNEIPMKKKGEKNEKSIVYIGNGDRVMVVGLCSMTKIRMIKE